MERGGSKIKEKERTGKGKILPKKTGYHKEKKRMVFTL